MKTSKTGYSTHHNRHKFDECFGLIRVSRLVVERVSRGMMGQFTISLRTGICNSESASGKL